MRSLATICGFKTLLLLNFIPLFKPQTIPSEHSDKTSNTTPPAAMNKAKLVFIPAPGLSHLVSTVEVTKLLLDRDHRVSITVLIMKLPNDQTVDKYISSQDSNTPPRLNLVNLPNLNETSSSPKMFTLFDIIYGHETHIREIVSTLSKKTDTRLAGLVMDMFCTKYIEICDEFNLPSYVFFTSGAGALGLMLHQVSLKFEHGQDLTQYRNPNAEVSVPCFSNPVPAKVLPAVFVEESPFAAVFMTCMKRLMDAKGIMVNTFYELEPFAVQSLLTDGKSRRIYPVGPILNSSGDCCSKNRTSGDDIKRWLDGQPERSVVFLCFGTMGSFEPAQVREIASALEISGKRFLWSLRRPGEKGAMVRYPTEYDDFREVLPEGFLERTEGIGKVTGWAAQVAVLSHPAVGGFVSHCGWNSILESVWFGVPMATFPLYAEQQANAFELVRELEMAEAIRIDYVMDFKGEGSSEIVGSEEIEAAIKRLMAEEGSSGALREKVKEMGKRSRMALMEGGSSYNAQSAFIEDVFRNIS
ncbi:hypothetical protein OROGR_000079 [Orobanche gracilis]